MISALFGCHPFKLHFFDDFLYQVERDHAVPAHGVDLDDLARGNLVDVSHNAERLLGAVPRQAGFPAAFAHFFQQAADIYWDSQVCFL